MAPCQSSGRNASYHVAQETATCKKKKDRARARSGWSSLLRLRKPEHPVQRHHHPVQLFERVPASRSYPVDEGSRPAVSLPFLFGSSICCICCWSFRSFAAHRAPERGEWRRRRRPPFARFGLPSRAAPFPARRRGAGSVVKCSRPPGWPPPARRRRQAAP